MRVLIDENLCENTACCVDVCPEDVFEQGQKRTIVVNAPACTNCWICVDNCIGGAINID